MKKKLETIGFVMQLVGTAGLMAVALYEERKRHEAKTELINTNAKLMLADHNNWMKDREIRELKERLEQYEPASEEKREES